VSTLLFACAISFSFLNSPLTLFPVIQITLIHYFFHTKPGRPTEVQTFFRQPRVTPQRPLSGVRGWLPHLTWLDVMHYLTLRIPASRLTIDFGGSQPSTLFTLHDPHLFRDLFDTMKHSSGGYTNKTCLVT